MTSNPGALAVPQSMRHILTSRDTDCVTVRDNSSSIKIVSSHPSTSASPLPMASQSSSEILFNGLHNEPASHLNDDDDDASELNLELLTASDQNNKVLGQKRKFQVKAEPHSITDQDFNAFEPGTKRARIDRSGSSSLAPLPHDTASAQNKDVAVGAAAAAASATHPFLTPVVGGGPSSQQQHHFYPLMMQQHHPLPLGGYGPAMPMPQYIRSHGAPFYSVNGARSNVPRSKPRRRGASDHEASSDDDSGDDADDEPEDRSPFRGTYISRDEEKELKKTLNTALYAQFQLARQSIFQQFNQKAQGIRHSALISSDKISLNVKIALIDAKVEEKKLFLNYLEMTRAQWTLSNVSMDGLTPPEEAKAEELLPDAVAPEAQPKAAARRVKKPKFSKFNVRVLRDWYETHSNNPYPSAAEKSLMCQLTALTKYQVSRWFCNVRTRKPPPEQSDDEEDGRMARFGGNGRGIKAAADPMVFGHEYYGRPSQLRPFGAPHPLHRMMPPLGIGPMNFHGVNGMNPLSPIPGIAAAPHYAFQQMMSRKRINALHPAASQATNDTLSSQPQPKEMESGDSEGLMPSISSNAAGQRTRTNTSASPQPLVNENDKISKEN